MSGLRIRRATQDDLGQVHQVRIGTAENQLTDPTTVTAEEVAWYLAHAIFLVGEDEAGIQGFTCANPQTGYVWALFVDDAAHGRGYGAALLAAALDGLREAGNRQAFLTTGAGTRAAGFYRACGWEVSGTNLHGDLVFRIALAPHAPGQVSESR